MNPRIISISILMFCVTFSTLFAGGYSEAKLCKELKEGYNISTFPLAQTTASLNYVFIAEDLIIRAGLKSGEALAEYNLRTKETNSISSPVEWNGRRVGPIDDLYYDDTTNTLHVRIKERLPTNDTTTLFFLLHLDDGSWEEIPELKGLIYQCAYLPENHLLYIVPMHGEDILVFNMDTREFTEQINMIEKTTQVYTMYGNPLHILGRIWNENEFQYYIFDTSTLTGKVFSNTDFISEEGSFEYYVYIDSQRFLCLNRLKQYESEVMELDLEAGTQRVVALESFPRELFYLKKVDETHYSFLTRTDDNWLVLCIMEYY